MRVQGCTRTVSSNKDTYMESIRNSQPAFWCPKSYLCQCSRALYRPFVTILPNKQHRHIINISSRRSCYYKPVRFLKCIIGIIILKHIKYINTLISKNSRRHAVTLSACRIGRTVSAITSYAEYYNIIHAINSSRCRQCYLLISSTFSVACKINDCFTACYISKLSA